jgi:hypothetical protein
MACLAEFPTDVDVIYTSEDVEPSGKYRLKLYCTTDKKWVEVEVDDQLPIPNIPLNAMQRTKIEPCYAKSVGDELWVVLLEKAFAKCFGSYKKLDGGNPWFAFQTMTGCDTQTFSRGQVKGKPKVWCEMFPQYADEGGKYSLSKQNMRQSNAFKVKSGNGVAAKALFKQLEEADSKGWLVAAGTPGKDTSREQGRDGTSKGVEGVVDGHAYSVIQVREVEGFQLLCVRNPWGTLEPHTRDWCDNDRMWDIHPKVKAALNPNFRVNDGLFWISWVHFIELFETVTVCMRGVSIDFDKEAAAAEKCSHCKCPLIKGVFGGKTYSGKVLTYEGAQGKLHQECDEAYLLAKATKCEHCNMPILAGPDGYIRSQVRSVLGTDIATSIATYLATYINTCPLVGVLHPLLSAVPSPRPTLVVVQPFATYRHLPLVRNTCFAHFLTGVIDLHSHTWLRTAKAARKK